ncbi:P68 family surface lipoprotein [Mesomycoplasma conjunctivae]|uniref:P68 family surface lipoprotein n=1 Tax=Mesomycoplasma conjunctivae TaxID=45361 RepID=UPI003DA4B8F4
MKVKLKTFIGASMILAPMSFLVACGVQANNDDKILFTTSQGPQWPLMQALAGENGLINYYNKIFKNDRDFVPVKLIFNTESKANSQADTARNISNLLNNKSDKIPSIALADAATAFSANEHGALLDLSKSLINSNLFDDKIISQYNSIKIANHPIYNIPFNINENDATSFNLDNLRIIFDIIENNGGQVDKSMPLYLKAQDSLQKGNNTPSNSLFYAIKAKSKTSFEDFHINQKTFENIDNLLDFVEKFMTNIEVDQDKLKNLDENTQDSFLLTVDYGDQFFIKTLISKTDSSLWEPNDNLKKFDFPIMADNNLRDKFSKLWEKLTKIEKIRFDLPNKQNKAVFLQSLQFKFWKNPQNSQWSYKDILNYRSVISILPSVAVKGQVDSPSSRSTTAATPEEAAANLKNVSTIHDVYLAPQILQANPQAKKVYWSGGSSLIGIKTGKQNIDKGAIKFLNWLLNGWNDIGGNVMSNINFIAEKSAYFVPVKSQVNQENLNKLKQLQQKYLQEINDQEKEKGISVKQVDSSKIHWGPYIKALNLQSVIISLESMLNALKSQNTAFVSDTGNKTIAEISNNIEDALVESTRVENPMITKPNKILEAIDDSIKSSN